MSEGGASLAIRVPCFSKPVFVQNKPDLTNHEKRALLKKAKTIADDFSDFGYDVYSSVFSDSFGQLYDLTIQHFLKIRQIENAAITEGNSRDGVIAKSDQYIQSIIDKSS